MKQGLTTVKTMPTATVRLGNVSTPSNQANVQSASVGLPPSRMVKSSPPSPLLAPVIETYSIWWLAKSLIPKLQARDTIIIDNASIHRSQIIDELVAEAECEVWYLPSYSPDLNKIEHWWFVLKNWMRQRWDEFDNFRNCVDAAFKNCPNVIA